MLHDYTLASKRNIVISKDLIVALRPHHDAHVLLCMQSLQVLDARKQCFGSGEILEDEWFLMAHMKGENGQNYRHWCAHLKSLLFHVVTMHILMSTLAVDALLVK